MTERKRLATGDIKNQDWLIDVLDCVNKISKEVFTLDEIYAFENELRIKHPKNNNIRPKIRQQLQFLRDKEYIEFLGHGRYRKIL